MSVTRSRRPLRVGNAGRHLSRRPADLFSEIAQSTKQTVDREEILTVVDKMLRSFPKQPSGVPQSACLLAQASADCRLTQAPISTALSRAKPSTYFAEAKP
jgi:hypothetical protein